MLANHTKVTIDVAQKMVRATYGTALDPSLLTPVLNLGLKYGLLSQPVAAADLMWKP